MVGSLLSTDNPSIKQLIGHFFALSGCKYTYQNCPNFVSDLTHPHIKHVDTSKYCYEHLDLKCQYEYQHGVMTSKLCKWPVAMYSGLKCVNSDLFCLLHIDLCDKTSHCLNLCIRGPHRGNTCGMPVAGYQYPGGNLFCRSDLKKSAVKKYVRGMNLK